MEAGLEPWGDVVGGERVLLRRQADDGVEVTDSFAAGVASLAAHKAYIDGLGWADFDPEEFLEGWARQAGTRLGVPMATTFEVFPFGWGE